MTMETEIARSLIILRAFTIGTAFCTSSPTTNDKPEDECS